MQPLPLALVICDAVWKDPATGKHTILGTFSKIRTRTFPARQQQLCVYFTITGCRGRTPISLRLVRADAASGDDELLRANTELTAASPLDVIEHTLGLTSIVFEKPGEYRFVLESAGAALIERKFVVEKIG